MKRGLSHIEFILSFVIFIGFILFAFVFFNPLQSNRTLKSSSDYAWIEISEETKAKVETYSVSINSTVSAPAVAIGVSTVPRSYNASIEDIDGNIIASYTENGLVHFNRGGKNFFRIKYSPYIDNGVRIAGTPLTNGQYYISSSSVEDLYFEKLFINLDGTYLSNYSGLKQQINIPARIEFGFVVKFNDSEISALNEIPEGLEVLTESDRIEIIRNSGKREYADLSVFVW